VGAKILIADDSPAVRRALRLKLSQQNADLEIFEAEDGQQAIAAAAAYKPDLILLDLAMPNVNGAEAAVVLKREMPEIPIILLTVYADDIGPSLATAVGVDMVLSKPEGLNLLLEMVRPILAALPHNSPAHDVAPN
jgi:two-component system, OmpR family, KDP operon response regulator KdpE